MKPSDEDGTFDLVQSINASLSEPMPQDELRTLFDERYPKLKAELNAIPVPVGEAPKPSEEDLLTQILESVRGLDAAISRSTEQNAYLLRSAVSHLALEAEARKVFSGGYTVTPNVASGLITGGSYVAPSGREFGTFVKGLADEVDAGEKKWRPAKPARSSAPGRPTHSRKPSKTRRTRASSSYSRIPFLRDSSPSSPENPCERRNSEARNHDCRSHLRC